MMGAAKPGTMPERAHKVLVDAKIDSDPLARLLAIYRDAERRTKNVPTKGEDVEYAQSTSAQVGKLYRRMQRGTMPRRVHAHLFTVAYLRGERELDLRERFLNDLAYYEAELLVAARVMKEQSARRGPKPMRDREQLLTNAIAEITQQNAAQNRRMLKKDAAFLALEWLRACSIAAPSPDQLFPSRAAGRAMKRARQK
jgi:hypothetical protein